VETKLQNNQFFGDSFTSFSTHTHTRTHARTRAVYLMSWMIICDYDVQMTPRLIQSTAY